METPVRMLDQVKRCHFQPSAPEAWGTLGLSSTCFVAIRMTPMPVPGAPHDVLEIGEAWLPVELKLDLVRAGDEDGWIARTALAFDGRNGMSRHAPGDFEHLAHAETTSVPQVINELFVPRERIKGKLMRRSQVDHMDVVSYAGAVGGWVVGSVDLDLLALAQGYLQNQRDQMGFGLMRFTAFGSRTRSKGGLRT